MNLKNGETNTVLCCRINQPPVYRDSSVFASRRPLYEVVFPKMARQLAILFREAKYHLECDSTKRCFELFGCDFMVDEDLEPWFLEVNTGPLLNERQYNMLSDTARIVFYNQPPKVRTGNDYQHFTGFVPVC